MTVREPLLLDRRVGRTAPRATKDEVNSAEAMAPRLLFPCSLPAAAAPPARFADGPVAERPATDEAVDLEQGFKG